MLGYGCLVSPSGVYGEAMVKIIKAEDLLNRIAGSNMIGVVSLNATAYVLDQMEGLSVKELEEILAEEYTKESTEEIYEGGKYDGGIEE